KQYHVGFMDATALRDEVVGGKEIRIVRVISDIFLWLAQVQTLIRLFPRHKEKVLIKWIGFALIILDTIFSGLNSFQFDSTSRPRDFRNAVPALSYLFQLALELLYAAWVLFYVATKRRYAFYHSKMKNICIVAILSVVSILTPVVFFVTDISQPDVDGWGDYFRWVGATAASVLVWEWVERIEALEREEKRDGILGREIFDGDEMLDVTPSSEVTWPGRRNKRDDDDDGLGSKPKTHTMGFRGHGLANIAQRLAGTRFPFQSGPPEQSQPPPSDASNKPLAIPHHGNLSDIAPPDTVSSPVSRAENNSAASTVYTVQYHPVSSLSLATEQNTPRHRDDPRPNKRAQHEKHMTGGVVDPSSPAAAPAPTTRRAVNVRWQAITNQFKRRRDTPPPEVRQAMESNNPVPIEPQEANQPSSRWAVKSKLASLAATTTELWQDKTSSRQNDIELPVTVIPAQPKGRTWSPGSLPLDEIRSTSTRDGITNSAAARDHSVRGRDGSSSNHRQSPTDAGAAAYTGFPVIATHPAAEITVLGRPDEQNSNSNDPRAGQDR
ncbi:MAG: pH-response regulator protein palH/rim21, partial [Bogoriella megaspora]